MKIDGVTVHRTVTFGRVLDAAQRRQSTLDNPGLCISCGLEQGGCEPDARQYECESCGEDCVYGAEELLLYIGGL